MTWEPLIAIAVLALAAVAGSSLFVRAASERDREIHLREDAAHRAARRRGLLPTGSPLSEAGPLLPAEPVPPPTARSPRSPGGARLRLRYAALILLAWALPASPGLDTPGDDAGPGAALENRQIERTRSAPASPALRRHCDKVILATGIGSPEASTGPETDGGPARSC